MPSHMLRPAPLTKEPTHPWDGVHAPDKMRDGSSPNSTIGMQTKFADGGLVGGVVTPLPSPGSALQPQLLAHGGKVKRRPRGSKGGKNARRHRPGEEDDTGIAGAVSDLTGRELQVENQIRAAEGLPPLKTKQ